ncbi:MAG: molybdopterin oxidoreductase family protein [Proteobacteria bacterium]|nr:molybdopterin oxidoreductase family protein [Pseudomonadota bacterium]
MARIRVTCALDCPDTCGLLAVVENGRLVKVEGDPSHPITRGFICSKVRRYPKRQYHPERPRKPMRRNGPKGSGRWDEISWDDALDNIAERLASTLDEYGGQAVLPYCYGGNHGLLQGQHPLAFFRAIGASELDKTICSATGTAGWQASYGSPSLGMDPEDGIHSKFIILWGTNTLTTNLHLAPILKAARKRGATIVHVDCYHNRTSRFADRFIRVKPGADAALAYAMAHVIIRENLQDDEYLAKAATGFHAYRAAAEAWSPARAQETTGVPAETIENLALDFAREKASFIRVSYGMTRHPGGGNALRSVVLLPALTGAWRYPGGGALASTSGGFPLNKTYLKGNHLAIEPQQPDRYFQPNPAARHINMSRLGTALTRANPPIRSLFVFNSNPAVVAPDSERIKAGLMQNSLFTVVLENARTETAALADYVLPATTFFEHPDLYTSYGHYYVSWSEAALEPVGESKPNTWIFAQLARRLGIEDPPIYWSTEKHAASLLNTDHPYLEGISLDGLRATGFSRLALPKPFMPFTAGAPTDSEKILFDPPPEVITPEPEPGYPLILLTPPAHHFLNSSFGHIESVVQSEGNEPVLQMHPQDASPRNLQDGDMVRIRSKQGEIRRRIRLADAPHPGAVVLEGTWWGTSAPDGKSVNALVSEKLTDMGEGPTFHATPVEVEKLT